MAHLTVRSQLTLAFGGLAAAVVLVSGMSLHALGAEGDRFNSVVHGVDKRRAVASELRTAVDQRAIAARNAVLVTRPADAKTEQAEVARAHDAVRVRLQELQSLMTDASVPQAARDLVGEIAKIEARYAPVALGILELTQGGRNAEAIAKMNDECRPLLAELGRASDAFIAFTEQRAQAMVTEAEADFRLQRNLQIVLCLLATGAALVAGYFITKRLSHALGAEPAQLGDVAQRVAAGDLGPVAGAATAPAGSVLASLGRMQASLADIVGQVRAASDSIATGSSQIAQGNADLSHRTEAQASALQQASATMDELGGTVRRNASSAEAASELANRATQVAGQGGNVVGQVVETMRGIQSSSQRIAEIIAVIDGIAFQTNILALNAAVEAARAGEHGRGFAVVAGEVRNLAQRSATAAREIKSLISGSVSQVEAGTALVDRAGATMGEIVASIERVSQIVSEISTASASQSDGVGQVGQAVSQMDEATQRNAALVEESAAAADSLKRQADQLVHAVSVFRLGNA